MARLKIEFRGAETLVSLARGETTVGRSNTCTIHLPDPQLAPIHFRIRPTSHQVDTVDIMPSGPHMH